jgi:hypothetical protein
MRAAKSDHCAYLRGWSGRLCPGASFRRAVGWIALSSIRHLFVVRHLFVLILPTYTALRRTSIVWSNMSALQRVDIFVFSKFSRHLRASTRRREQGTLPTMSRKS